MNAKKQREKNRRRANKLAQDAWQAASDERADLAVKIIGRAVDLNPGNPVLWWSAFQQRCSDADQMTPSPLLLRYEAGGFNALHQDIRGDVFFPVQLVIVLSSRAESATDGANTFTGGEFLFCDQPERKRSDRCAVPAGRGDAVFFCTRSRLVRVGGAYGLKPVKHGLNLVTTGVRYAVGIPFHEFR